MMMKRISKRARFAGAVLAAAALGTGGGVAYAYSQAGSSLAPAGLASEAGGTAPTRIVPDYPINAAGLTYGSLEDANSPEDAPDLILVEAQDGTTGYVKRAELDAATGADVSNPAEALAYQKSVDALVASGQRILLPVYAQDGVTVVGQFEVTPSQADPAGSR